MRGRKEAAADSQLLSTETVHGLHRMFLSEAAPPDCWRARREINSVCLFFQRFKSKFMTEKSRLRASLEPRLEGSQHFCVTENWGRQVLKHTFSFRFFFLKAQMSRDVYLLLKEHAKTPSVSPHFRWSCHEQLYLLAFMLASLNQDAHFYCSGNVACASKVA